MEPSIDYDELAMRVATQLRKQSLAYAMAQNALVEDNWLHDQFVSFVDAYAPLIARRVTSTADYDETFKVKLKYVVNSIY